MVVPAFTIRQLALSHSDAYQSNNPTLNVGTSCKSSHLLWRRILTGTKSKAPTVRVALVQVYSWWLMFSDNYADSHWFRKGINKDITEFRGIKKVCHTCYLEMTQTFLKGLCFPLSPINTNCPCHSSIHQEQSREQSKFVGAVVRANWSLPWGSHHSLISKVYLIQVIP